MLIVSATWAQFTFLMKIEAERLKKKKGTKWIALAKAMKDQVIQFVLIYHV